jgi:hypothetical protein
MRSSSIHLLAALAIALGFALAIGFAEAGRYGRSWFTFKPKVENKPAEVKPMGMLTRICKGEDVDIISIQVLRSLRDDIYCDGRAKAVLRQLIAMTDDPNVCSEEKANKIAKFYKDWLAPVYPPRPDLLQPFEKFYLDYGLMVSDVCTETLMKSLPFYPKPDRDDIGDVELLHKPGSPIYLLLTPLIESDAITLPSLFLTVLPVLGDGRMLVQSDHSDIRKFEHAQKVCRLRFRPLYHKFLKPIAVLAKSGFIDTSKFSKMIGSSTSLTKIIFLCELLDSMQFDTNGADDEQPSSGRELKLVRNRETHPLSSDSPLLPKLRSIDASKCAFDRRELFVKVWKAVFERYEAEGRLSALVELIGKTQRNEKNAELSELEKEMVELTKGKASLVMSRQARVADDLYKAGEPGHWIMKAAIAGLLLPPGAALHPIG